MICIVPAAVSFEGQPLLDYMMLKDGHVVPARSSIALQRGENNDTRWAPPVFDVDGVRIAVILTWTASSRCCRPASTSSRISNSTRLT